MRTYCKIKRQSHQQNLIVKKNTTMSSFVEELSNAIQTAFESARPPAQSIPPVFILAESSERPGLSAITLASNVISRMPEIGVPTDPNPDGSENINNKFIQVLCEEIINHIKEDAVIECSIAPGSVQTTGTGGNAGGPVTVQSMNTNITSVKGVLR